MPHANVFDSDSWLKIYMGDKKLVHKAKNFKWPWPCAEKHCCNVKVKHRHTCNSSLTVCLPLPNEPHLSPKAIECSFIFGSVFINFGIPEVKHSQWAAWDYYLQLPVVRSKLKSITGCFTELIHQAIILHFIHQGLFCSSVTQKATITTLHENMGQCQPLTLECVIHDTNGLFSKEVSLNIMG